MIGASPAWGCQGNTELEAAFCRLKGKGVNLPSMDDFRRNSPSMQYLLLKRPAHNAGMTLVKPSSGIASTTSNQHPAKRQNNGSLRRSSVVQHSNAQGLGRQNSVSQDSGFQHSTAKNSSLQKPDLAIAGSQAETCELKGRTIHCDQQRFLLIENRFNHELASGALAESNQLLLSAIPAQLNEQQQRRALSLHYGVYVDKMLKIGLAGVAMSFSRFYYTWQNSAQQGQEPSARFARMYEFLKRDKKSIAVDRRVDDSLPESLNQCMRVSVSIWTCDKGRRNWVFSRH